MYVMAVSAMDATREIESELGIDGGEATEQAIDGMLEAAGEMEEETQSRLREAVASQKEDV